jgi:hypothetical protein
MISAQPCPQCEAIAPFPIALAHRPRARAQGALEQAHSRCAECGWRGWLFVLIPLEEEETAIQQDEPDLSSLDHSIGARPMRVAL